MGKARFRSAVTGRWITERLALRQPRRSVREMPGLHEESLADYVAAMDDCRLACDALRRDVGVLRDRLERVRQTLQPGVGADGPSAEALAEWAVNRIGDLTDQANRP